MCRDEAAMLLFLAVTFHNTGIGKEWNGSASWLELPFERILPEVAETRRARAAMHAIRGGACCIEGVLCWTIITEGLEFTVSDYPITQRSWILWLPLRKKFTNDCLELTG